MDVVSEFKPAKLAVFQPGDINTSIRAGAGLSVVLCYSVLIFSLYRRKRLNIKFKKRILINKFSASLYLKKNETDDSQAMAHFYFHFPLT
jgi:hypothetical protein